MKKISGELSRDLFFYWRNVIRMYVGPHQEVGVIRFLDEPHHVAVLLCDSVEDAISVLINIHNKPIGNPARNLRVCIESRQFFLFSRRLVLVISRIC
jgi:hypothetical protein